MVLKRLFAEGSRRQDLQAALREVEVARRVSHPNVLAIHDCQQLDDGALVVAEYAEGGSVRDLLRAQGPFEPAEAARVLRGALQGLGALHEAGIVHGDLKPENLLLDGDGTVKVGDFGIARLAAQGHRTFATAALRGAGTPAYMASEAARGEPATFRSDLYSLGAVAFELLSGTAWRAAREPWVVLRKRLGADAEAWKAWLGGALEMDPPQRPASAAVMSQALPVRQDTLPARSVGQAAKR